MPFCGGTAKGHRVNLSLCPELCNPVIDGLYLTNLKNLGDPSTMQISLDEGVLEILYAYAKLGAGAKATSRSALFASSV